MLPRSRLCLVMKTSTSLFCDPEYESPVDGCEIQVRWPELVATACSSSLTSEFPVFYECAPLPGGLFLAGVGYVKPGPGSVWDRSLRETVLARMVAGHDLAESVRTSALEFRLDLNDASVCYAVVDPSHGRVQWCQCGAQTSILHIVGGVASPARRALGRGEAPGSLALRPGEALLIVAHPRAWDKYLLGAVDQNLRTGADQLAERDALRLCGHVQSLVEGESASILLYKTRASQAS